MVEIFVRSVPNSTFRFFPSFMQYVKLKLVHRKDVGGEKAGNAAARGGAAPTSPGRFGTVWSSTRKPNPGKKV